MKFITERAVAASALGFLVAAAVDKSAASSNALVGVSANLIAKLFTAFAAPSPEFFKEFPNLSASIVLSEKMLLLVLLHILQSTLNISISSPVFFVEGYSWFNNNRS